MTVDSEAGQDGPQTSKKPSQEELHITEQPWTLRNWHKHIWWPAVVIGVIVPIMGITAVPYTPLKRPTLVLALIFYFNSALGIAGGYHRLWTHRAYKASFPLKVFYSLAGGSACQGDIIWWAQHHRRHHRWTDTAKDPHDRTRGFLHSHYTWAMLRKNPKGRGSVDMSDLWSDPVCLWQLQHMVPIMVGAGFVLPTVIAGLGWGDWQGGFVYPGLVRVSVLLQTTACVNSIAHWRGDQPFDNTISATDHMLVAWATNGEGYHNFHHTFPSDYRSSVTWWQYDPTKWFIWACSKLGLAWDLQTFPANEIEKGRVRQLQRVLEAKRAKVSYGRPIEELPVMSWDTYRDQAQKHNLIVIAGVVYDAADFVDRHPGGKAIVSEAVGTDATAAFNGGVYSHSNVAHDLLSSMRVGVIDGGGEVEVNKAKQPPATAAETASPDIGTP